MAGGIFGARSVAAQSAADSAGVFLSLLTAVTVQRPEAGLALDPRIVMPCAERPCAERVWVEMPPPVAELATGPLGLSLQRREEVILCPGDPSTCTMPGATAFAQLGCPRAVLSPTRRASAPAGPRGPAGCPTCASSVSTPEALDCPSPGREVILSPRQHPGVPSSRL